MENISIIIQARSNSTRFKRKIYRKIGKHRLIEWVIKRLKKTLANEVILATSNNKNDKKLEKFCKDEKIIFFSGPEKNVLKRYFEAGKFANSDIIIRVCADNPFVDPLEINHLIKKFKKTKGKYDYYFNHRNYKSKSFADGFGAELFKSDILQKILKSKINNYHKEHVTSYIWDNMKKFKIMPCKTSIKKKYHSIVADINTKNDYIKLNRFVVKNKIKITFSAKKIALLLYQNEKINL